MIQKVRAPLIATNAVSGNNITPASITGNLVAPYTITSNLIANNTITNSNLSEPNAFEDLFLMGGL